jgi:hypothetical protein
MAFSQYSGYRGRNFPPRRGRGGFQPKSMKRSEVKPDLTKHPLGELLASYSNSDLDPMLATLGDTATISNSEYVTSYNWLEAKSPTIIVPGMYAATMRYLLHLAYLEQGKPPLWTPLQQPRRLKEDSGLFFRDPNAARFPAYPTEPAVQALFHTNPGFVTEDVDIFGCGSTIGNLLRFVRAVDKPFRFDVEVIGKTVFFIRKENDPRETIDGIRGYGHTFPEAYTTWESDVKGSESHQRLVQYDFGGFKCIVRFECDGYLPDKADKKKGKRPQQGGQNGLDDLLDAFDNTTIKKSQPSSENLLTIQSAGSPPSQDNIFDLKTRSGRFKKEVDMSDIYPSLWLKQFPNFIIAYHDGAGTFEDIRVQNVKKDVQEWEKANKAAIQRLAILIRKIIEVARLDSKGLLEVYSDTVDRLEIRRQHGEGSHALPLHLKTRWEDGDDGGVPVAANDDLFDDDNDEEVHFYPAGGYDDSDDEDLDFTACSVDDCGYCGKCTY